MGEKIKLDPRYITDEISENTPSFVVSYIARLCRFEFSETYFGLSGYYSDLISNINNHDFVEIQIPTESSGERILKKVIKFISPLSNSEEWFSASIIKGFEHLMYFKDVNLPLSISFKQVTFGQKSNNNPLAFNELIIYKLCKLHNYIMSKDTTLDELIFFLTKLYDGKTEVMRNSLIHNLLTMSNEELLKIAYHANKISEISENNSPAILPSVKDTTFEYTSGMIELTYNNLNDKTKLMERVKPKNHYEAVIIAAQSYNINLLDSDCPLKELELLTRSKRYTPHSQSFARKYIYNKNWYKISDVWVEELSPFIYSVEQLRKFALNEGYELKLTPSVKEFHQYLKYSRSIYNFYFDKIPTCQNITFTLLHDDVNTVDPSDLICFGSFLDNRFVYMTVDELIGFFESHKIYIDMIGNNPLDEIAINKLKIHCNSMVTKKHKKFEKLRELLTDLDKAKKIIDMKFRDLKIALLKEDEVVREDVKDFFMAGIEMGLYMRGWKLNGNSVLPLTSEETVYEPGENNCNHQRVFYNSIQARNKLDKLLLQIPTHIIELIRSLHAIKFSAKEKGTAIFGLNIKGAHVYMEKTIFDCMESIYGDVDDDDACVRTNSSWILYSFVWYSIILGYEIPFKIDRIDNIT